MTPEVFKSLEIGDVVRVIDWPGFANPQMRTFIGREYVIGKIPDTRGHVKLHNQNGEAIFGSWQYKDLELVSRACESCIEADMAMLFC